MPYCGDGHCDAPDEYETCPEDCSCGNGVCEAYENQDNCAEDCNTLYWCTTNNQLPDFVVHDEAESSFAATCQENRVTITLLSSQVVKLDYGTHAEYRSFAVTHEPRLDSYSFGSIVSYMEPGFSSQPGLNLCTGDLRIELESGECRLTISDTDGTVLLSESPGDGYSELAGSKSLVRNAPAGEPYFGLGEKTGRGNRRGRAFIMRNTDCYDSAYGGYGPDADPLYASIPFYVGIREGKGYGVFTDNTHRMEFDLGYSSAVKSKVTVHGGAMVQYFMFGPTLASVAQTYSTLTGRAPMPPRWSLGYHQCRWGYYPDSRVLEVAQELRARSIPSDGMWLDIQAMDGYRSFTFDSTGFADPAALMGQLSDLGYHTTMIVDPGIKVDDNWDIYSSGVEGNHFLKNSDGSLFVGEVWPGAAVFPDFSSPGARSWWQTLIPRLTQNGIEGIWIDMNEPASFIEADGNSVPDYIPAHGNLTPTTMAEIRNVYALLEAEATYNGLQTALPGKRPFVLTRAGYSGIQRYAAMWTGDAPSSWPTLKNTLPMMTGLGLSGVPVSGSDVGGYSGVATPEMFARWMQIGSFSPFFRGHTERNGNDQEPWAFGQEVEDISRAVINERYRLLPTLYSLVHEASVTGAPIIRPLYYEHQHDTSTYDMDDQVYLGSHLMFAPVVEEGAASRTLYLPEGRWFDYWSGQVYEGPQTLTINPVTLAALPAFVREGGILFKSELAQTAASQPEGPLHIDAYPGAESSSTAYYEDDGASTEYQNGNFYKVIYTVHGFDTGATFTASAQEGYYEPPQRKTILTLRRVEHVPGSVTLDGTALSMADSREDALAGVNTWWFDDRDLSVVIVLDRGDDFSLSVNYDPAVDPDTSVEVLFRITVPAGTSQSENVYIHTDRNNWEPHLIPWSATPGVAEGTIPIPRGEWFYYKFTRGDWDTVEKLGDCSEMDNRYGYSQGRYAREETVATWADWCP